MADDSDTDAVFQALAQESRRRMLDIVRARPGLAVGALAAEFDVSRIAVMKHLAVLEKAGLVVSTREGRARRLYFNAVPIRMIYERWTDEYGAYWSGRVLKIKEAAETRARAERTAVKKRGKQNDKR
jgi:DNA-binding transcriptional ArsR family regulator